MKTKGVINNGLINKIKLGEKTTFDINTEYITDTQVIIRNSKISDERGLQLGASGQINLPTQNCNFDYDLATKSLRKYLPDISKDFEAYDFSSRGSLEVRDKLLQARGFAKAKTLIFRDYNTREAELKFDLNNKDLVIRDFSAQSYGGTIKSDLVVKDFEKSQKIEGHAKFVGLEIKEPIKKTTKLNIEGLLEGQVWLSGSVRNPNLSFDAKFPHLVIDKLIVPHTLIYGTYNNNILKIERLNAEGFLGSVMGKIYPMI